MNSIVGAFKPESTAAVLMARKVGRAGVPEIGLVLEELEPDSELPAPAIIAAAG